MGSVYKHSAENKMTPISLKRVMGSPFLVGNNRRFMQIESIMSRLLNDTYRKKHNLNILYAFYQYKENQTILWIQEKEFQDETYYRPAK